MHSLSHVHGPVCTTPPTAHPMCTTPHTQPVPSRHTAAKPVCSVVF